MKKLLLTILLINTFILNIDAESYNANYSISLSYNLAPTYSVKIPKTLDISNNNTSFNYYVCGDIYADSVLQVKFDEEVTITNSNTSKKAYISQNKTNFKQNELTSDYAQYSASITHDNLSSGKWQGQLNVVISLIGDIYE